MGGPNGVGLGNQPQFINFPGTGNVGTIGNVQPGGTQPNIAPQQDIAPQTTTRMPTRAADVVGQLDVLLMKAVKNSTGDISANDVMNAAKEAKLPKKTRNNLQTLAETAQAKLAALDKFTGKDLAAAMGKQGEMVDWKEGNATAQAFKEAQSAQQDLSRAIADALGKIKDGNAQAVMEELMLQCDRRIGELDTLALQMADIIDKGGENTESKAASLAGSGTISSYTSANALDKFGRAEMLGALKSDLQPLLTRLDAYEKNGGKNLTKNDMDACVSELNTLKAKFSDSAANGFIEIGQKRVFMDRSLLAEASKLLDGVGNKINSLHREVLHRTMVNFVEKDIPFIDEEIFSPKFTDELGKLTNDNLENADKKLKSLVDFLKKLNEFRSAARAYAESPDMDANASKLNSASVNLAAMKTNNAEACLTLNSILSFKPADDASKEFKTALKNFQIKMGQAGAEDTPIRKQIRSVYGNIKIATTKLIKFGNEFQTGEKDKYFVSSAVLDVFKGDTSLSPLVESRVHGYSDSDINTALDDKNVTESKTLGSGSFNTVTLVKVKDGSEWVFKPELAGRLTAPNSPLNHGLAKSQEMTRINLAVQTTADTLGLGDIMVKTSAGTHKGQFGMFMEKAPGITGKKFKESEQPEIKEMNDADFGKVVGNTMRKFNRMQWFDTLTGQGDRHADNYMIKVDTSTSVPSVDIKAIDNDASYGVFRQGLYKFTLRPDSSLLDHFNYTIDRFVNALIDAKTGAVPKKEEMDKDYKQARNDLKQTILNDACITKKYDGTVEIDLSKPGNTFLMRGFLQFCGIKSMTPPAEIDKELYDKLMNLAPDGGIARKNYLNSLAERLGKDSMQYKAAVQRLDESIAHARKLANEGKVYTAEQWEDHDVQREIAAPNMATRDKKIDTNGAKISDKTLEAFTHKGKYASYTNTFFRDFYDVLIKGSKHEDWFAPKS